MLEEIRRKGNIAMKATCKHCGARFEIDPEASPEYRPTECEDCEATYEDPNDPGFYDYMQYSDADPGL
jgi:hydrogenase maturation factor HypF (carbamoyltransferase family)